MPLAKGITLDLMSKKLEVFPVIKVAKKEGKKSSVIKS